MLKRIIFFLLLTTNYSYSQFVKIALLKYDGGGDWYANPSSLNNLIKFCNNELKTGIVLPYETIEVGSPDLFKYPFVHLTGHGNVIFNPQQTQNLRKYLISGGFLHIDDNYGLEKFIRNEMKKVFPETNFIELSKNHPIFKEKFDFSQTGLPKIHEHDNKPPQAFGIFYENRMVVLFTYETDLGDGWEDKQVHNDKDEIRLKALQMGANIISYVFKN